VAQESTNRKKVEASVLPVAKEHFCQTTALEESNYTTTRMIASFVAQEHFLPRLAPAYARVAHLAHTLMTTRLMPLDDTTRRATVRFAVLENTASLLVPSLRRPASNVLVALGTMTEREEIKAH
jgi:hypothetical protein